MMLSATRYYDRRYVERVFQPLLQDEDFYQTKARCAARVYFGSFPRPLGPVLEYGCGLGQNIAAIDHAIGFDVNPVARDECRKRGISVLDCPSVIPKNYFQYVLCRHVLEHVEQPLELLRELFQYLTPTGRLILVLPVEFHRRVSLTPDVHRHFYCWNFRTINNLIWQAGGQPVSNAHEPMFGRRIHRSLKPILRLFGLPAYLFVARWLGRCVTSPEQIIHAVRRSEEEIRSEAMVPT
jgi:SAM-dependent methyltransferase